MKHLTNSELGDLINQATGSFSFHLHADSLSWWQDGSRWSFDTVIQEVVAFDTYLSYPESAMEQSRRLRG